MESFARLVVLAIGAALVVSLIREGPGGPTRWLKAKFLGTEENADQQAARIVTSAGVPVSATDIANAPPLSASPPGVPAPRATTTPRAPTTPRSRLTCPAGFRLIGGHCIGAPAGARLAGPGRPVGTF